MTFFTRFKPPKSPFIDFSDSPSLTHQEFEPECNINNILAKFKVTGVLVDPAVRSLRQPMFIDCTSLPDLAEYHEHLGRCKDSFDSLPKEVKEAFGYDSLVAMHWLSKATDAQVVHLFKSLVPSITKSPSKGGLGGASTPQNSPSVDSAPPAASTQGAEPKSQEPPRSQVVDAVNNGS